MAIETYSCTTMLISHIGFLRSFVTGFYTDTAPDMSFWHKSRTSIQN